MATIRSRIAEFYCSSPAVAYIVVFLTALAARSFTAVFVGQPGYMDSYYYFHVAENLFQGRGFVEDFVWNYLENPSTVAHPSNAYWMPLSSVVVALSFQLFGLSFRAAQVPMVLVSSVLPIIGYGIGKGVFRSERYGLGIAALTIFAGMYSVYWVVPESFGLFAVFGSLALVLAYKALRDSPRYLVPAGAAVALAQLTRADGIILFGSLAAAVAALIVRRSRTGRGSYGTIFLSILGALFAYALVQAPWLLRNANELGGPLSTVGAKAALLREYNDTFTYGHQINLEYYLAWGLLPILRSKVDALGQNLWVWTQMGQVFLAPFALIGMWRLRGKLEYLPFHVYNLLLFFTLSLVFTFQGPRGSYAHSGAALLPFFFGAALVGLDSTVAFAARFRPKWIIPVAQRNFTLMLVAFSMIMGVTLATVAIQKWDDQLHKYQEIASYLTSRTDANEPVMLIDPPRYHYVSGRPSIVFSNDSPSVVVDLARRFGVRYLVLEPAHTRPIDAFYNFQEDNPDLNLEATVGDFRIYRVISPTAVR